MKLFVSVTPVKNGQVFERMALNTLLIKVFEPFAGGDTGIRVRITLTDGEQIYVKESMKDIWRSLNDD